MSDVAVREDGVDARVLSKLGTAVCSILYNCCPSHFNSEWVREGLRLPKVDSALTFSDDSAIATFIQDEKIAVQKDKTILVYVPKDESGEEVFKALEFAGFGAGDFCYHPMSEQAISKTGAENQLKVQDNIDDPDRKALFEEMAGNLLSTRPEIGGIITIDASQPAIQDKIVNGYKLSCDIAAQEAGKRSVQKAVAFLTDIDRQTASLVGDPPKSPTEILRQAAEQFLQAEHSDTIAGRALQSVLIPELRKLYTGAEALPERVESQEVPNELNMLWTVIVYADAGNPSMRRDAPLEPAGDEEVQEEQSWPLQRHWKNSRDCSMRLGVLELRRHNEELQVL